MAKRVNLRWQAAVELSAAHAAYVVASGAPCSDPKTEQLLVGPVTDINNRLVTASISMSDFWRQYVAGRLAEVAMPEACTSALLAAGCSELQVDQIAKPVTRQLSDGRQAFQKKYPKLAEQLELRTRPLKDRWDTVGQGLLREVERQIWDSSPPSDWWPARVDAWMVQPIRGGDGDFDHEHDSFWMEAMLTDVDPSVPEVLRVAWLLTRMAIHRHTKGKLEQALSLPWSLASVPIVLTAGIELEVIRGDLPIRAAMELWQFGDDESAEILQKWWTDHQNAPTPLPVALKKLQQAMDDASLSGSDTSSDEVNSSF